MCLSRSHIYPTLWPFFWCTAFQFLHYKCIFYDQLFFLIDRTARWALNFPKVLERFAGQTSPKQRRNITCNFPDVVEQVVILYLPKKNLRSLNWRVMVKIASFDSPADAPACASKRKASLSSNFPTLFMMKIWYSPEDFFVSQSSHIGCFPQDESQIFL